MPNRILAAAALVAAATVLSAPAASAAPVTGQDSAYVKSAHQGNLAEIAAGEDAQKNATTSCVKKAGGVLVRDHGKLDADLKMLADKLSIALPASPTAEQQKNLMAVQAKAGTAAYDAAWLADQSAAHTKTLALIDKEIAAGGNADVVAAARSARPVVAMHLDMVRSGTCHAGKDLAMVGAGTGGQLAAREDRLTTFGTLGLVGGGVLLTAGATFWLARRRPSGAC